MSILTILFIGWCVISLVWLAARQIKAFQAKRAAAAPVVTEATTAEDTFVPLDVSQTAFAPTVVDPIQTPSEPTPAFEAPAPVAMATPDPVAASAPAPMPAPAAQAPPTPAPPPLPPSVARPVDTLPPIPWDPASGPAPEMPAPSNAAPQPAAPAMPTAHAPAAPAPVEHAPVAPAPVTPHPELPGQQVPLHTTLRGLSDVLAGVQMPCDLGPLMGESGAPSISERRASFYTTTHRPAEVGGAMASELERLGMTIQSVSENQAVATRDTDSIMLTIHRTARMFPTAPEMAVVIEIELV